MELIASKIYFTPFNLNVVFGVTVIVILFESIIIKLFVLPVLGLEKDATDLPLFKNTPLSPALTGIEKYSIGEFILVGSTSKVIPRFLFDPDCIVVFGLV